MGPQSRPTFSVIVVELEERMCNGQTVEQAVPVKGQ